MPELIEIGLDALNPLEVKAGMDPSALKKKYGDQLVLHGGINAVLWDDLDADRGRDAAGGPGAEGERRLHLLLGPLRAVERQPGKFSVYHESRERIRTLLTQMNADERRCTQIHADERQMKVSANDRVHSAFICVLRKGGKEFS